jgi:hypothetical protein|tara:strand:- start:99 stop:617 length:519 start_codon:yes stop_codon:yes gene_type:complete
MNKYSRLTDTHMLMLCMILKPSKPSNWKIALLNPAKLDQAQEHDNIIEFTFPKNSYNPKGIANNQDYLQVIVQFFPHATDDSEGIKCWFDLDKKDLEPDEYEIPDNLISSVDDFFKELTEKNEIDYESDHGWLKLRALNPLSTETNSKTETNSGCTSVILLLIISTIGFLLI